MEWGADLGSCPGIQVKHSESGGGSEQTQHKYILWEDWTGLEDETGVEMSERNLRSWPEQPNISHSGFPPGLCHTYLLYIQRLRSKLFRLHFER